MLKIHSAFHECENQILIIQTSGTSAYESSRRCLSVFGSGGGCCLTAVEACEGEGI